MPTKTTVTSADPKAGAGKASSGNRAAGDNEKIMFFIAYVIPLLTGLLVFLMYGSKDKRLRFHGIQAFLYGVATLIFSWLIALVFFFFFLGVIADIVLLLLWLYGLYIGYKAGYEDKDIELPFIGSMAKKS